MTLSFRKWLLTNGSFFHNTSSLIASTLISSGLGFMYWWLAARLFSPEIIGLGSALTSAMLFLGTLGRLGLDNFLISEIPKRQKFGSQLLTSSLWLTALAAGLFGLGFALLSPLIAKDLSSYFSSWINCNVFALGVALTSLSMVLDKALIAYMWGYTQFWRNTLFAGLKMLLLFFIAWLFFDTSAEGMILTWVLANLVSIAFVLHVLGKNLQLPFLPKIASFRGLGIQVVNQFFLDIAQSFHTLIMPVLSVALFGVGLSGAFYIAWTFVMMARIIPLHMTTVLHAIGSRELSLLRSKMQMTLKLSFIAGIFICLIFALGSHPLLKLFGSEYAEFATLPLKILAFSIFPHIIKVHFLALARVKQFVAKAALLMTLFTVFEVIVTFVAANAAGMLGLSYALLGLYFLEACVLLPSIWKTVK